MTFSKWLVERNQRDATKMPEKMSNLELHKRVVSKSAYGMQHGRAGTIETKKRKGSRGESKRGAIERSSRED